MWVARGIRFDLAGAFVKLLGSLQCFLNVSANILAAARRQ
jgi:hypothetical protein